MSITVICHNCQKPFRVEPKRVKRACKYCSMGCRKERLRLRISQVKLSDNPAMRALCLMQSAKGRGGE